MIHNFSTCFEHATAQVETRKHLAAISVNGVFVKCVKACRARTALDCIRLLKKEVPSVVGPWHLV